MVWYWYGIIPISETYNVKDPFAFILWSLVFRTAL